MTPGRPIEIGPGLDRARRFRWRKKMPPPPLGFPEAASDKGIKRGSLRFVAATTNGNGIVGVKASAVRLLAFVAKGRTGLRDDLHLGRDRAV